MNKITKARKKLLKNLPKTNVYSLSFTRILLFLSPFFFFLFLAFLINLLPGSNSKRFSDAVIFAILFNSPLFFLLLNHLILSPIKRIRFNTDNNSISILMRNNELDILYEDIRVVEIVETTGWNRFPWNMFEYAILHLKNNAKVYVSCLLLNPYTFLSFGISRKASISTSYFPYLKKTVLQVHQPL
jgi:hypothetical protein